MNYHSVQHVDGGQISNSNHFSGDSDYEIAMLAGDKMRMRNMSKALERGGGGGGGIHQL